MVYFGQGLASVVVSYSRLAETAGGTGRKAGVTLNKYGSVGSATKPVVSCPEREGSCRAAASVLPN